MQESAAHCHERGGGGETPRTFFCNAKARTGMSPAGRRCGLSSFAILKPRASFYWPGGVHAPLQPQGLRAAGYEMMGGGGGLNGAPQFNAFRPTCPRWSAADPTSSGLGAIWAAAAAAAVARHKLLALRPLPPLGQREDCRLPWYRLCW